jgi:hypothetical protein
MQSEAILQTAMAPRYLGQFCKHFAHKLPVELDETNAAGVVTFGSGHCRLNADAAALTITVDAADSVAVVNLQDVVARHLVRFAFREEVALAWSVPA